MKNKKNPKRILAAVLTASLILTAASPGWDSIGDHYADEYRQDGESYADKYEQVAESCADKYQQVAQDWVDWARQIADHYNK